MLMFLIFTLALFIEKLKESCNVKKSNENFFRDFFKQILKDISLDDIKIRKKKKDFNNKNDDDVFDIESYLEKSTISKLRNNKINILKDLKNKIFDKNNKDKIHLNMDEFIKDNMELTSIDKLIEELKSSILEVKLTETEKESIKNFKTEKKEEKINFIYEAFRIALKNDNKLKENSNSLIWNRGKNSVNAIIGDLFKYGFNKKRREEKNIVVIPVDTSFETKINTLENDFPVSETTIHGQFLSRMCKITVKKYPLPKNDTESNRKRCYTEEGIKNLIEKSLTLQGIKPLGNNSKNKPLYPIGTIAVIYHLNTIFYLLAISQFDENNNAQSNENNIKKAIENLLDFYDKNGEGYPLYLPLIGTWLSRVDLTNKESLEFILSTMMENKDKIHGKINIVISKTIQQQELEELYKVISEWKNKYK